MSTTTIITICTPSIKCSNIIRRILQPKCSFNSRCYNNIGTSVSTCTSTSTGQQSKLEFVWMNNNNTNYFSSYSRMLDLGGAPSSMNDTKTTTTLVDVSKNCKIQAILIDFDLLTSTSTSTVASTVTSTIDNDNNNNNNNNKSDGNEQQQQENNIILGNVTPDIALIENVTSLLQKTRGTNFTNNFMLNNTKSKNDNNDDDLSLLLSGDNRLSEKENNINPKDSTEKKLQANNNKTIKNMMDITAKYSDKLFKRGIQGGAKGLLVLKEQKELNNQQSNAYDSSSSSSSSSSSGDASDHLAARKLVMSNRSNNTIEGLSVLSSNRWMSLPGTGVLLKYLSNRCMKIVLLPKLPVKLSSSSTPSTTTNPEENYFMNDFQKQLQNDVHITYLHQDGTQSINDILNNCIQQISNNPGTGDTTDTTNTTTTTTTTNNTIMIVSNKDNYLSIAKTLGIMTVRLCPPNTRRGNVSCHYTIQSLIETQDIINSINGISFKI